MDIVARKPNIAACEQQRRRPDCAYAQSDQRLWYSLSGSIVMLVANLSSHNISIFLARIYS